jgi:hypothetical protein
VAWLELYDPLAQEKYTYSFALTYSYLLCLSKVILWVGIQSHYPKWSNWDNFLRDKFSRVQNIEAKSQLLIFIEDLNTELKIISNSSCQKYII